MKTITITKQVMPCCDTHTETLCHGDTTNSAIYGLDGRYFLEVENDGRIRFCIDGAREEWQDSGLRVDFDTMTAKCKEPATTPLRDLGELANALESMIPKIIAGAFDNGVATGLRGAQQCIRSAHVAENAELVKLRAEVEAMGRIVTLAGVWRDNRTNDSAMYQPPTCSLMNAIDAYRKSRGK